MEVTVGRTLHYILNEYDVQQINRRRTNGNSIRERIASDKWPVGAQAHIGNHASVGDEVPMIVVRVWPHEFGQDIPGVNGQAFLDGNDALWLTSIKEGTELGTWHWPERK